MNRIALCFTALLAFGTLTVVPGSAQVSAVPQVMNFQGRLTTSSGNPVADGTYSVRLSLHDALTGGTEKYSKTVANVQVKNGTFAVTLDAFPVNTFEGNLWLEIKIGTDVALTPRTPLVSVPYAMKSDLALTVPDGSLTAAKFAAGVINSTGWLLGGNNGVTASQFLGTTDTNPLELRVNNRRIMRYQYAENSIYRSTNVLGGSELNTLTAGVIGATIAGGGYNSITGTDLPNQVTFDFGTVGGGYGNAANGNSSTVGGGRFNTAANDASTVGGGVRNTASNTSSTIAGGANNLANNTYSTIAGGNINTASGNSAAVGGGQSNTANNSYSNVAGGSSNTASGVFAAVGGGNSNLASGNFATIPGGNDNTAAGSTSFAAGNRARANHNGAFVWADNTNADFASTGPGQFLIRAGNGVGINTDNPGRALLWVRSPNTTIGICAGDLAPDGAASFQSHRVTNTTSYHFACTNSGVDVFYVNGSGRPYGTGSYVTLSDVRYKTHVNTLDNALDSILNLRGVTYEWDTEQWKERGLPQGRQIGFIAQEVEKILPELVTTDKNGYKMVSYSDAVPVLVEAVKTLKAQKDTEINALKAKNAELEAKVSKLDALEAKLAKMATAVSQLKARHK